MTNIPEEDRALAVLKINTKKRPDAVKEIAAWLRKTADYIVEHEGKNSQHLTCRLFASDKGRPIKQVGQRDILPIILCIGLLFAASCKTSNEIPEPPAGKVAILSFTTAPSAISSGGLAKLSWNVSGVSTAAIDNGIGTVPAKGEAQVSPKATTVYTLIAGVPPDQDRASVTVTVNATPPVLGHAEIKSFKASDYNLPVNGISRISWEVANAVTVKISGEGTVALSGNFDRKFEYTEKIGIEATGTDGKAVKDSLTVSVDRRSACDWLSKAVDWTFLDMKTCKIETMKNESPYYSGRNLTYRLTIRDHATNAVIDLGTGDIPQVGPGQIGSVTIKLASGKTVWEDKAEVDLIHIDCDFK